jgi:hypothetical protein
MKPVIPRDSDPEKDCVYIRISTQSDFVRDIMPLMKVI